jgi:hypothetical protein
MSFESLSPQESSPKDVFIEALNKELSVMEQSGRISPGQAEEKRTAAALIEEGFSDDPTQDALIFSKAGIAGEKEIIGILDKSEDSFEEVEESEESPFKHAYFHAIRDRVVELQEKGELPEEFVKGVLERAAYVEGPFENEEDAEEKGLKFLEAIEPIAEFMRGLNNAEMHLLTFSGDIDLALETLKTKVDISEEKKKKTLDNLQVIRDQIDDHLERIRSARAQIV